MEPGVLESIFDGSIQPRDIKLSVLESITENFSEERIIGDGGFATVYKGVLPNGEVAVKKIKKNKIIDDKLFRQEVTSLLKVNHKNIVRFLGYCSHTDHKAMEKEGSGEFIYAEDRERLICFEYINNGSLAKYIADELRGLQWDTRYSIIKGICEGLHYLHMTRHILHMDLKPANILIDDSMVAKITDFGLSRMAVDSQTKCKERYISLGYTAPEYIDIGSMTVKNDVYSLGIIIIELVTGKKSIPDSNNVLRRWRHRWHKSGKETPFRYQQITKLIEIGLQCQEKDPYKRPFISNIISDIHKLESTDGQISNTNKSTVGQISPCSEDDMLGIEPLELHFPIELNTQISSSLELTNETNAFFAFSIQTTSPLPYCIQPNKYIVAPRSNYSVNITLQPLDHAAQDWHYTGDFIVRSTKVNASLTSVDITEDIFNREGGKLVDEVNLTIAYKAEVRQVDVSLGSLTISDTRNQHDPNESNVSPAEAEAKICAPTSDEVIQFDPPELCFPLVPNKRVLSSINIINITESFVSCHFSYAKKNTANYSRSDSLSIMSPRSTRCLTIIREEKEDAVKDMEFNDEVFVGYAIVPEDINVSDLNWEDYNEWKKLPIILAKVNSCTSNDMIQFDPPELSFPCLNQTSISSINIVNVTDCYVGYNIWFPFGENNVKFGIRPQYGILPPRSTERLLVKIAPEENKLEELFVWSMIVAEGLEASKLCDHRIEKDSKKVPSISKKISPCTSDVLIRFDDPGLCFNFLPDKIVLSSVNMVNVTNYYVGFHVFNGDTNAVHYHADPAFGILAPRSARRLVIKRLVLEKEQEDMQYKDRFFVWSNIVSEDVKVRDINCYKPWMRKESNELPIILNKINPSTAVELIKLEPPEVRFPFLPSKKLLSSIKIVNITDYHVGFSTYMEETNMALYITEPPCGILTPWSTQEVVVTRVAKEEAPELEDIQCKDKYFVWSTFVTEDVMANDLRNWMPETERKELPLVFMETTSNKLIEFDPPEICLPLLPNRRVLSSAKIVNITDQYIGYRICDKKSNSARYNVNPSEGILSPMSTQLLLVSCVAQEKELEESQCKDMFLVWNGIVTEDVKTSDVIDNMPETKSTELPIVLTKTGSSTSEELVQFDPPGFHFPFLPNKKVLSSFKIVNLTDYSVGFNTYSRPTNAAWYHTEPPRGVLPPQSTQKLMVTREEKEDALTKDRQLDDKYFVWKSIVSDCVKDSDLSDCMSDQESKELPIVLGKISSLTSDELIKFDPAELCMPIFLNKITLFKVNVVNTTDFYIAFNGYFMKRNAPRDKMSVEEGILPPRSTKKVTLRLLATETEIEDMEAPDDDYFVWSRVVTEAVDTGDIISYMDEEESKHLPIIFNKTSPRISNELVRFDPPELSLPFMPNKALVFSVNIVNNTDCNVRFDLFQPEINVGWYYIKPAGGVMPPRSTQRLVVKRIPDKKEEEDMQCQDKFCIVNYIVSEGIEVSDFVDCCYEEISKELPIVYTKKTSLSTSDELIQFDVPQLHFDFLPNKRVSMLRFFQIVNVTDQNVGFNIWSHKDNYGHYVIKPKAGILPPQSTQAIKVRRTLKKNEQEDIQCKDKIFVWNGIVAQGVEVSDVQKYRKDEDKELPVVLTKPGERIGMVESVGCEGLSRRVMGS